MSPKPNVSEERKEQITEAATKVFAEQGFDKARMDDIAAEAKLSKGTLYLYFKSKDAIIKHLLESLFEREFADLSSLIDDPRPASEKLMLFAEKFIGDMHKWSRLIPIMYEFLGRLFRQSIVQEAFKKYLRVYLDMVTPIIQQGIDKGEFKEADASEIAITFGALLEGTILIWVYDSDLVDLEKNLRASIKLLMEGIIK
ncbi:MAG: TetR/AcrR family transcriptional regulator [Anaerolineae bacterium]|nr:TetR/AcrR family transcriptional regulator [Anaerolineae bacterium]MBT7191710.1 TetR/AcrR family transcriptional regulator [Anaerolineae bacterium]MBT7990212.1 TetR/AcrR family transcriptional regulator [Anaerolineae bacterium]